MDHGNSKFILIIAIMAVVNYFLVRPLAVGLFGEFVFTVITFLIPIFGGWYVVAKMKSSLRFAALMGIIFFAASHVVSKGGFFLMMHFLGKSSSELNYLHAFEGVVISFIMFVPAAALLSLCGGLFAKVYRKMKLNFHL